MTPENWSDLYDRLKNAENELEELADATNDPAEASRLMSKMHGVSLARDYMRGYFDPSSIQAAAPTSPPPAKTLSVYKYVIAPFTPTRMPVGAKILYVGEHGDDVCAWALVDFDVIEHEDRHIYGYGTGHFVRTRLGRYVGSVQMTKGVNNGLVFHFFDEDDV